MRKNIRTIIALGVILLGSFSTLLTPVAKAQSSPSPERVRDAKFHAVSRAFSALDRTTRQFPIIEQPLAQPTATAAPAIPAIADPDVILTLIGVIGAFVAVVVMLFALRGKGNK